MLFLSLPADYAHYPHFNMKSLRSVALALFAFWLLTPVLGSSCRGFCRERPTIDVNPISPCGAWWWWIKPPFRSDLCAPDVEVMMTNGHLLWTKNLLWIPAIAETHSTTFWWKTVFFVSAISSCFLLCMFGNLWESLRQRGLEVQQALCQPVLKSHSQSVKANATRPWRERSAAAERANHGWALGIPQCSSPWATFY